MQPTDSKTSTAHDTTQQANDTKTITVPPNKKNPNPLQRPAND